MLVVVTRLTPHGLLALRSATALVGPVVAQLEDLPGFTGGRLLVDRRRDMWTLTTWSDRAALVAFRELHAPVAARIDEVARFGGTSAWQQDPSGLPSWADVRARWTDGPGPARGLSRVLPPSRARAAA